MKTGEALKFLRKRQRMTQKDISSKMNKSQQWVSDLENDVFDVSWEDLKKILNEYESSATELFNLEDGDHND